MAVVTNDYTSQTTPIDEPDTYTGRHTGVFEKRNGRWMVIAEDTEEIHDDKLMERQVAKAGRDYNELIKRLRSGRSSAELERVAISRHSHVCSPTSTPARPRMAKSYARPRRLSAIRAVGSNSNQPNFWNSPSSRLTTTLRSKPGKSAKSAPTRVRASPKALMAPR